MRFSPVRLRTIATLAGLAAIVCGCNSNAAPDPQKVKVLDTTMSTASSNNLLLLDAKLDAVYDQDMADVKAKVEPEEKKLIAALQSSKPDVKGLLEKDHDLFSKAADDMKQGTIDLSNATSPNVDPMEHDKYIAYYTAIGEALTARHDLYQDILDYEAKPDDKLRLAILDQELVVQGKELAYTEKKR